jgi:hypothetical protein
MGQTTNYLLPWPDGTMPADAPQHIGDLARRTDDVLYNQIWTPLDSRLDAIEAQPPPTNATATHGEVVLTSSHDVETSWTTVLSTPLLAAGKFLLIAMANLDTRTGDPQHWVYVRLRSTSGVSAAGGEGPTHTISGDPTNETYENVQLSLQSIVDGNLTWELQAHADAAGQGQVTNITKQSDTPGCTRLTWIKLA